MTRRRRTAALLGLAALLGGLAASDVAGREAALDRALGPTVTVVVARTRSPRARRSTPGGSRSAASPRASRRALAYASPDVVAGARAAADLQPGEDVTPAAIDDGSRRDRRARPPGRARRRAGRRRPARR